jgi:hypothetical protein
MQSRVRIFRCITTFLVLGGATCVAGLGGGASLGMASAGAAVPCSGVSVAPGANVQAVLNASGAGTTFCFQPGAYVLTLTGTDARSQIGGTRSTTYR